MSPTSTLARAASRAAGRQRIAVTTAASRTLGAIEIPRALFRAQSTRMYSSTMHENNPEVLEREKQRNLAGKQFGKMPETHDFAPGWNETLASTSEAHVKADKAGGTPLEMQRKTVEYMKIHSDPENRENSTSAAAGDKDEVTGPLQTAGGQRAASDTDDNAPFTEQDQEHMTASEADVKADRREFKGARR